MGVLMSCKCCGDDCEITSRIIDKIVIQVDNETIEYPIGTSIDRLGNLPLHFGNVNRRTIYSYDLEPLTLQRISNKLTPSLYTYKKIRLEIGNIVPDEETKFVIDSNWDVFINSIADYGFDQESNKYFIECDERYIDKIKLRIQNYNIGFYWGAKYHIRPSNQDADYSAFMIKSFFQKFNYNISVDIQRKELENDGDIDKIFEHNIGSILGRFQNGRIDGNSIGSAIRTQQGGTFCTFKTGYNCNHVVDNFWRSYEYDNQFFYGSNINYILNGLVLHFYKSSSADDGIYIESNFFDERTTDYFSNNVEINRKNLYFTFGIESSIINPNIRAINFDILDTYNSKVFYNSTIGTTDIDFIPPEFRCIYFIPNQAFYGCGNQFCTRVLYKRTRINKTIYNNSLNFFPHILMSVANSYKQDYTFEGNQGFLPVIKEFISHVDVYDNNSFSTYPIGLIPNIYNFIYDKRGDLLTDFIFRDKITCCSDVSNIYENEFTFVIHNNIKLVNGITKCNQSTIRDASYYLTNFSNENLANGCDNAKQLAHDEALRFADNNTSESKEFKVKYQIHFRPVKTKCVKDDFQDFIFDKFGKNLRTKGFVLRYPIDLIDLSTGAITHDISYRNDITRNKNELFVSNGSLNSFQPKGFSSIQNDEYFKDSYNSIFKWRKFRNFELLGIGGVTGFNGYTAELYPIPTYSPRRMHISSVFFNNQNREVYLIPDKVKISIYLDLANEMHIDYMYDFWIKYSGKIVDTNQCTLSNNIGSILKFDNYNKMNNVGYVESTLFQNSYTKLDNMFNLRFSKIGANYATLSTNKKISKIEDFFIPSFNLGGGARLL